MKAGTFWGRTDLGQPVRSSHIEITKLTDCIQTNSFKSLAERFAIFANVVTTQNRAGLNEQSSLFHFAFSPEAGAFWCKT
ncbi:hypothetical protein DZF83_12660 [Vibrio parahaemolyticus]|nr:hypothetical protein [Vibrio parahaemolyticus]